MLGITDYTGATPKTYVPVTDATGSIVALTDDTGAVVAGYHYDPFGNLTDASGPAKDACPFRFAEMYYDAQSGTCRTASRVYDPRQGRF